MDNQLILQLMVGILVAIGAGYVGSFMVLRGMSLVGDALSHVALPGIALALLFSINPFFGAFMALFAATVGVWFLERRTELASETLVGVFFTLSLAAGLLITPEPELLEALFGDISRVNQIDFLITLVLTVFILLWMKKISGGLIIDTISRELAEATKIQTSKTHFLFMIMVALVVALGIKVVGVLLMGSLVIIPAAAAKNISTNLHQYGLWSVIFAAISSVFGILSAYYIDIPAGPTIVIVAGLVFIGTLIFKK